MNITRDEWLAALDEAKRVALPEQDPGVVTSSELAELMGVGVSAASRAAHLLISTGQAERTTKTIQMIDGRLRRVSAYRLLKREGR